MKHLVVGALAAALIAGTGAFAEEKAAAPAPAPAPAAKPAATPATPKAAGAHGKKAVSKVAVEATGKLASKMVKNPKTGKEQKAMQLTIASAKGADGKPMDALKGKTVIVRGKSLNLASFDGKDVTVTGDYVNNRAILAKSIK